MITMSASPMAPGETKLIGFGERFVYVKRLDLSHVVDHCARDDERVTRADRRQEVSNGR